jgi:hypothetical protein
MRRPVPLGSTTKVKAKMVNTSLIQTGADRSGVPESGATWYGMLYAGAFSIWTYHEWYDDPTTPARPPRWSPPRGS